MTTPHTTPPHKVPDSSPPSGNGRLDGPRRAPDLGKGEADLVAWFAHLERPDAPASLRTAVLESPLSQNAPLSENASVSSQKAPRAAPAGRLLRMFPMGAWGLATAALVLVAFGAGLAVELADPVAPPAAPGAPVGSSPEPVTVLEDPTLALFHDLQTFDDVGREDGELLADWVR